MDYASGLKKEVAEAKSPFVWQLKAGENKLEVAPVDEHDVEARGRAELGDGWVDDDDDVFVLVAVMPADGLLDGGVPLHVIAVTGEVDLNSSPQLRKAVLSGIDAGIARLGAVPALQDLAIGIEVQQGNFDAALARYADVVERTIGRPIRDVPGAGAAAYSGQFARLAEAVTYQVFLGRSKTPEPSQGEYPDVDHYTNFIEAVRANSREKLNAEVEEGHRSTAVCHVGNISYRLGRSIRFDPKTLTCPGDAEASLLIRAVRYVDARLKMPPGGKLAENEIAALAVYLASDEAGMVNAATLSVDGGWTAW